MGVEPAFDPIRSDERFDQILEHTGYRMFFKNFSKSGINLDASGFPVDANASGVHDLTTLVIEESDKTDDGTTTKRPQRDRKPIYAAIAALLLLVASIGGYYFYTRQQKSPVIILSPDGISESLDRCRAF
jgi:hypothetical protein